MEAIGLEGRHREGAETGSWSWRGLASILCWDGEMDRMEIQKKPCALLLCVQVSKRSQASGWLEG